MITIKKSKGTASCQSCFAATYTSEHPAQRVPVEVYELTIALSERHNSLLVSLCSRCLKDLGETIGGLAERQAAK
jgi:transcription elongation factor Elf1